MHELPQVPHRGDEAESKEDQGVCGPLPDARDGALTSPWLRQSVKNCALRDGQRPYAEGRRAEARICDRGRVRPRRRSSEDGQTVRRGRRVVEDRRPAWIATSTSRNTRTKRQD